MRAVHKKKIIIIINKRRPGIVAAQKRVAKKIIAPASKRKKYAGYVAGWLVSEPDPQKIEMVWLRDYWLAMRSEHLFIWCNNINTSQQYILPTQK